MQVEMENYKDDNGDTAGDYATGMGFRIDWHNGPIKEDGGRNGAFVEEVMKAVIDKLRCYQRGNNPHPANSAAITYIEKALAELHERKLDRIKRGVEGTNQK